MPPPPRKVRKHFLTRYTVKNGISNLYILLKSVLEMQEMPFQRPKFQTISEGACPRIPLQLCRHYVLPLTKILATPLSIMICTMFWMVRHLPPIFHWNNFSLSQPHWALQVSEKEAQIVVVPEPKTEYLKKCFKFSRAKLWNELPNSLSLSLSLSFSLSLSI